MDEPTAGSNERPIAEQVKPKWQISGVSFSELDPKLLRKNTKKYSRSFPSEDHLTHICDTAVLPLDCYPKIHRPDGIYKDPLEKLYETYAKKEDEASLNAIRTELKSRWNTNKTGRWRSDVCGKRCNYTARSVLSPNPTLKLVEVGLPRKWRSLLTILDAYDGVMDYSSVVDEKGRCFDKRFRKAGIGDLIRRELCVGDLVMVNRQPTLRVSNFVSMHVRWVSEKTIQMHPGVFSMFDADCDGDEINIHVPQSLEARKELESMHISKALFDLADYSLNPSVIQDAMVGCYLRGDGKNKREIHKKCASSFSQRDMIDSIVSENRTMQTVQENIENAYMHGCSAAYEHGFSIDFGFSSIDTMIGCGAKGKTVHKERIRQFYRGIYDNDEYFRECQADRKAIIATSLKTADTGYISRRMTYHLNDVCHKNGQCVEDGKWYVRYGSSSEEEPFTKVKNIGLYLVTVLMPPLTQKMLDSFHTTSAGDDLEDETSEFNKIINCTHSELLRMYNSEGIMSAKKWIYDKLVTFYDGQIDTYWIRLLCDFLCMTGRPLGMNTSHFKKRMASHALSQVSEDEFCEYGEAPKTHDTYETHVFKTSKFSNAYKHIHDAAKKKERDMLTSSHGRELFM